MWIADDTVTAARLNRSLLDESYSNHLGNTDNFTETAVGGDGSASANAANHRMDLSSGIQDDAYARYNTKKTFTLSANPIILNTIVQNLVEGAGGIRATYIGFKNAWSMDYLNCVLFAWQTGGAYSGWDIKVCAGVGEVTSVDIDDIVAGDLLTIVAYSTKILFYKNGSLLQTVTTTIPSTTLYAGYYVYQYDAGGSVSRETSCDYIDIKVAKT